MKTPLFATLLLAFACNASADPSCGMPNYVVEGDEAPTEAPAPQADTTPYAHPYVNGGHFEGGAPSATLAEAAPAPARTAWLPR